MAKTWYAQASSQNMSGYAHMWNDVANGSGNWLDPSNDGSMDGLATDDTLRANGKTSIAINANVTCSQLDTVTSGGGFVGSSSVTITANIVAGTSACFAPTGTPTITITGNVTASSSTAINLTSAVTLNITGNITGGSGATSAAVKDDSGTAATINVTGNVTASTGPAIISGVGASIKVTSGNIVDTATVSAIVCTKGFSWNPGNTNYFQCRTGDGSTTRTYYYDIPDAANVRETDTVAGVTGTVLTKTLSAANDTVGAGYYAATTLSTVDTDLAAGNIVSGKTIFGVAGSASGSGGAAAVNRIGLIGGF